MIKILCDFLFGPPPVRDVVATMYYREDDGRASLRLFEMLSSMFANWVAGFEYSGSAYLVMPVNYDCLVMVRV